MIADNVDAIRIHWELHMDRHRLDRILTSPLRLILIDHLHRRGPCAFSVVMKALDLPPGHVSHHAAALEAAGYIEQIRTLVGKKALTTLSITPEGRRALAAHKAVLAEFVGADEVAG